VVLYLVSVVAVACLVVAALVIVRDYQSRDQVPNGDAKYDLTGWQVGSDAGRTSLNRLHIEDGPAGHDTAALIDRNGEGFGDWSRALVAIDRPAEALTVGRTYTLGCSWPTATMSTAPLSRAPTTVFPSGVGTRSC